VDNHPILLILAGFVGGSGLTTAIWSRVARRRRKAIDAWHNLNHSATGSFVHALSQGRVTTSNKVQQRVTVGAEDE
jgi:hypothetical protein